MEIFNLKEIDISFENFQHTKVDAKGIERVSLNEYEYIIGDDKVYSLYIELSTDTKYILTPDSTDKFYEDKLIRRLYNWDDIDNIDLYYQDGTKSSIKPYWGKFNVDEINLYQHGKYQVDKDGNLTGKFILELYVEKLTNDLQSQIDKRKQIRDYIYETLWEYNPIECKTFNGIRPINVYRDKSNVLTNYIHRSKETNIEEFKNILFDSIKSQWDEGLDENTIKEKLSKIANIMYKELMGDKKL